MAGELLHRRLGIQLRMASERRLPGQLEWTSQHPVLRTYQQKSRTILKALSILGRTLLATLVYPSRKGENER